VGSAVDDGMGEGNAWQKAPHSSKLKWN